MKITIKRKRQFFACVRKVKILVDGKVVGAVRTGRQLTIEIPSGLHEVLAKMDWLKSDCVTVNGDASSQEFVVSLHSFYARSIEFVPRELVGQRTDSGMDVRGDHGEVVGPFRRLMKRMACSKKLCRADYVNYILSNCASLLILLISFFMLRAKADFDFFCVMSGIIGILSIPSSFYAVAWLLGTLHQLRGLDQGWLGWLLLLVDFGWSAILMLTFSPSLRIVNGLGLSFYLSIFYSFCSWLMVSLTLVMAILMFSRLCRNHRDEVALSETAGTKPSSDAE